MIVLLLALFSCQSQQSWEVSHVAAQDKEYHSARLSHHIKDIINGIGVEMVCAKGQVSTYLEVRAQKIPPYQGDPKEALVIMKVENKTFQAIAQRHEGGQRLTLPPQLHQLLVESLQLGSPVTILLEGYFTTLDPKNFSEHYQDLQTSPLNNPFQLPFKL